MAVRVGEVGAPTSISGRWAAHSLSEHAGEVVPVCEPAAPRDFVDRLVGGDQQFGGLTDAPVLDVASRRPPRGFPEASNETRFACEGDLSQSGVGHGLRDVGVDVLKDSHEFAAALGDSEELLGRLG